MAQTEEKAQDTKGTLRPAQIAAAALAAVTGAFLASQLGVFGTVLGAGVFSVLYTVGSDVYLRSLDKGKVAARAAKEAARSRTARLSLHAETLQADDIGAQAAPDSGAAPEAEAAPDAGEVPATEAGEAATAEDDVEVEPARRRLRWPLIAGISVAAFVIGMLAVTGIEAITGGTLSGQEGGSSIGRVVTGDIGQQPAPEPPPQPAPTTTEVPEPETTDEPTEPAEEPAPEPEPEPEDEDEEPPVEEEPEQPDDTEPGGGRLPLVP